RRVAPIQVSMSGPIPSNGTTSSTRTCYGLVYRTPRALAGAVPLPGLDRLVPGDPAAAWRLHHDLCRQPPGPGRDRERGADRVVAEPVWHGPAPHRAVFHLDQEHRPPRGFRQLVPVRSPGGGDPG